MSSPSYGGRTASRRGGAAGEAVAGGGQGGLVGVGGGGGVKGGRRLESERPGGEGLAFGGRQGCAVVCPILGGVNLFFII